MMLFKVCHSRSIYLRQRFLSGSWYFADLPSPEHVIFVSSKAMQKKGQPKDLKKQIKSVKNNGQTQQGEKNGEKRDLDEFVRELEQVLFRVKSTFPFDLFPDELLIDQAKISAIKNNFFFSRQVKNILLDDIGDITVESGPVFATLTIFDKSAADDEKEVLFHHLPSQKAFEARRLIQGLVLCKKEKVDLSGKSLQEIKEKVSEIGKVIER